MSKDFLGNITPCGAIILRNIPSSFGGGGGGGVNKMNIVFDSLMNDILLEIKVLAKLSFCQHE